MNAAAPVTVAAPEPSDADWAAALFAMAPASFGGLRLRCPHGPDREAFLARLRALLQPEAPWRKLPLSIDETRLTGGLDLGATLRAGRPVVERGLLAEAHGGIVVIAMAERLPVATAARIAAVLDSGEAVIERDGISRRLPAEFGLILLDEGIDAEEQPPLVLLDRTAFHVLPDAAAAPSRFTAAMIATARMTLPDVTLAEAQYTELAAASLALGVDSLRALQFASAVARGAAALERATTVTDRHLALAMRLVFVPRATRMPESAEDQQAAPPPPEPPESQPETDRPGDPKSLPDDIAVKTAQAVLPESVLRQLASRGKLGRGFSRAGRAGGVIAGGGRGRPAGVLAGAPGRNARFNLIATLRAAAPWQKLRRGAAQEGVRITRDDWRVTRLKRRSESTTIFVVDASGSTALHRLGEAKGAVELMLAECYIRRDHVALIAFRGKGAEIVLPPTRSLARARRSLAGVPGGGGTPLAAALESATDLAAALRGKGKQPVVVLLSDGRGNVTRDGRGDRAQAETEAMAAAQRLAGAEIATLFIDTAPRAGEAARRLAAEAGARYLALPHADAAAISRAVQDAVRGGTP
jgi:magnesium chelatase subunit D